jgi:CspA family cold shock protein
MLPTLAKAPRVCKDVLLGAGRRRRGGAKAVVRGTVWWFSEEKGYGFISPDEGAEEVFVHYTEVEGEGFRSLKEGERVSYEVAMSSRGAKRREEAKDVRRIVG